MANRWCPLTTLMWLVAGCYSATPVVDADTTTQQDTGSFNEGDSARPTVVGFDTNPVIGNPDECLTGVNRCRGDVVQYCQDAQWVDMEDCASVNLYCISPEDEDQCGFCLTEDCVSVDIQCYSFYGVAACGPYCIDAYPDMGELAETCTFEFDWDRVPGQLGVTRGCNLIRLTGEDPSVAYAMGPSPACEDGEGWFFPGGGGESDPLYAWPLDACDVVELCPATCERVRGGEYVSLYLTFGCFSDWF